MSYKIPLFVALFLLALVVSAFFAASETALVSLSRIDLQRLREKGDRRGGLIRALKSRTSGLLATILIGQNLALSSASALATALATFWVGERWGVPAAIVVSTVTLFIFAEMAPKAIAAASPLPIARAVAVPMTWIMKIFSPLVTLVVQLTTRSLRLLGIAEKAPTLTEEEMKSVINLGADEGVIHGEEKKLLHKVLEFGDKTVRDIMVPRTRIVAVAIDATFMELRSLLREHKLSRIPVYRETLDNVIGILHAKDLFDVTDEEEASFRLDRYLDAPFLVPEFKPAEDLFREMRRRRTHMAIVVDEFGGTAGIATIEDAIEELLGPIQDEFDEEESPGFVAAGRQKFLLQGDFRLDDLQEQFGIALPRDQAETIAGHLMHRFGRIPRKGERWRGRRADFVIEEASPTSIDKVLMILPEKKEAGQT
ncbi:MAG TPA: hemolysin family protein [Thermoanaerobaculia bacterium]|nr:hemolysin family protein [Thermoanaerobaculia bacterium]